MTIYRVKDHNGLVKNTENNSIVNENKSEFQSYIENRKRLSSQNEKVDELEQNVQEMKNDLNDIKDLLKKLANGQ
jgi:polyhydroxyalkanoate synthesis regulator phasin|tara:strand:- start:211 stop:435 length:225 start_codon:yes stop_codon:yes gene_type:complete